MTERESALNTIGLLGGGSGTSATTYKKVEPCQVILDGKTFFTQLSLLVNAFFLFATLCLKTLRFVAFFFRMNVHLLHAERVFSIQWYFASVAPEMRQFQGFFNTVLKVVLPNKNFSSTFFFPYVLLLLDTHFRGPLLFYNCTLIYL